MTEIDPQFIALIEIVFCGYDAIERLIYTSLTIFL